MTHTLRLFALTALLLCSATLPAARAQFWTNQIANPVVQRTGDGSTTLSNASAPAALWQYLTGVGAQVSPATTTAFASTGTNRLVVSGNSTAEGYISNSLDRGFVNAVGYDADAGIASIAATTGTVAPRALGYAPISTAGLTSATGNSSLSSTTAYSGSNIRSAASLGGSGSNTWSGGTAAANNGVRLNLDTAWATSPTTNIRAVELVTGSDSVTRVFYSTQSGTRGIYVAGATTDTAPITATILIDTTATGGTAEFVLFNNPNGNQSGLTAGVNTAYIADERVTASNGGIQKWTWNGTTWVNDYTLRGPLSATQGVRGLSGYLDANGNAVLFTTDTATSNNSLWQVTDTGAAAEWLGLASAGTASWFRGVALSPTTVVPEPMSVLGALALGGLVTARVRRRRPAL